MCGAGGCQNEAWWNVMPFIWHPDKMLKPQICVQSTPTAWCPELLANRVNLVLWFQQYLNTLYEHITWMSNHVEPHHNLQARCTKSLSSNGLFLVVSPRNWYIYVSVGWNDVERYFLKVIQYTYLMVNWCLIHFKLKQNSGYGKNNWLYLWNSTVSPEDVSVR